MKKITLSAVFILLAVMAFADGLVSKSNQSAQYIRMLSRNASTGLDAFFYNPAGLAKLENGTYISVNNQFLLGEKNIISGYSYLNDPEYSAEIRQMVFPTVFAAYKTGDLALSLGFVQAGGGGRAGYDQGLASFEIPVSKALFMIPNNTRTLHEVQGYDADISFSGNSVYQGIQLGAAYQASKELSVYGGLRILPAKNLYEGSISNVQLKVAGEMVSAPAWLNGTAADYSVLSVASLAIADLCSSTASSLQQYITMGAGSFTLSQIQSAGYISSAQSAQLVSRLTSLGFSPAQVAAMNIRQVQATFISKNNEYSLLSSNQAMTARNLADIAPMLIDREIDTEQTGTGYTPVIGVNITPVENLNIGVRYEMKTRLNLTNNTDEDGFGLFPDKEEVRYDIPAVLGIGAGYKAAPWLEGQFSVNYYFDKAVDWGQNFRDLLVYPEGDTEIRDREIEKNSYEIGLGLQIRIADDLALSLGGLMSKPGIAKSYQSDFSFVNSSFTFGAGLEFKIRDYLTLDAGFSNTIYEDAEVSFYDPLIDDFYIDIFSRKSRIFAIGLTYNIKK